MLYNPTSHNEFLPHIIHNKPCRTLLLNLGCNIFYSHLQLLLPLVRRKVTVVLLVITIRREVVLSKTITINHTFIGYRQHSYCGFYNGAHTEKIKIFWRQSSVFPVLYHTVVNMLTYSNQKPRTTQKHNSQYLNFTHWPVPPLPVLCNVHKFWRKKLGWNDHIGF
jgi:hypothetical protein